MLSLGQRIFYLSLVLILEGSVLYNADATETLSDTDKCVENNTLCTNDDHVEVCEENQFYDPERSTCLLLAGELCETTTDCIQHSICTPKMNATIGKFMKRCACQTNYFKTETGLCASHSKYGEFCDPATPCETNSPLMICVENVCSCSNQTTQVYDRFKRTCVLRIDQDCYDYRSLHRSICPTNAYCHYFHKHVFLRANCICHHGYVASNDSNSEGQICAASFGQACNQTSICNSNTGLVCTDGKCQCDSPLHQVFESGYCRSTVGAKCDETTICVNNASCNESSSTCECNQGFQGTLTNPLMCKLDYGSQCFSGRISQFQCNHDRGMVCKSGTCACYDSTLFYRNSMGICGNDVGQVCGAVHVVGSQIRLDGMVKVEYNFNQNYVTIGCNKDLLCGKVQGQATCTCFNIESLEPGRALKIEPCLSSSYYN